MPKKITDLDETLSVNTIADLIPIVQDGDTKKIKVQNILKYSNNYVYQGSDIKSLTANWESTRSTVRAYSSTVWNYEGTDIKEISSVWQDTNTIVFLNSAGWENTESLLTAGKPNWDATFTVVQTNSASQWQNNPNWNQVYTVVQTNSTSQWQNDPNWNSVYATTLANSASNWQNNPNWNSVYTTTLANSASNWQNNPNWNSVYSTVLANSASNWNSTNYLPLAGGTISSNLQVNGNHTVLGQILCSTSTGIVNIATLFGSGGGGSGGTVTWNDVTNKPNNLLFNPISSTLHFNNTNGSPANLYIRSNANIRGEIYTTQAYPIVIYTNNTPSTNNIFLGSSGQVGIGTVSPEATSKLNVKGNIVADNNQAISIKGITTDSSGFAETILTNSANTSLILKHYSPSTLESPYNGVDKSDSSEILASGSDLIVRQINNGRVILGNNQTNLLIGSDGRIKINSPDGNIPDQSSLTIKQYTGSDDILKVNNTSDTTVLKVDSNGITLSNTLSSTNLSAYNSGFTNSYIENGFFENGINTPKSIGNLGLFASYNKSTTSGSDTTPTRISISTSTDSINFNKLFDISLPTTYNQFLDIASNDSPSFACLNNIWYIAIPTNIFSTDVVILTSKDLVNFTFFADNIKLNGNTAEASQVTSPKWFVDDQLDDQLYLSYTVSNGTKITRLTDTNNPTIFNAATAFTSSLGDSNITNCYITKYGSDYHFAYIINGGAIRVAKRATLLSGGLTNVALTTPTTYNSPILIPYFDDNGVETLRLFVQTDANSEGFYPLPNTGPATTINGLTSCNLDFRAYRPTGIHAAPILKQTFDLVTAPTHLVKNQNDPYSIRSPKAWGRVDSDGTLRQGYNCAVTASGAQYTITLTERLMNALPCVIVNATGSGNVGQTISTNNTTITITLLNSSGGQTPAEFHFMVFGD